MMVLGIGLLLIVLCRLVYEVLWCFIWNCVYLCGVYVWLVVCCWLCVCMVVVICGVFVFV